MKAKVKFVTSPDIYDLKSHRPDDKFSFSFLLEFTIGLSDKEGGDQFEILVLTPKWLIENKNENEVIFGRHMLIVFNYDMDLIIRQITQYCENCSGDNWEEVAKKISRIAHWEFEDYISKEKQ